MREGVQYPQLRGLVADWLERASQPTRFVTECIELIHEKISKDPNNCSTEGDANTWVAVFLLLDCLRGVPVAWEECNRKSFRATMKSGVVLCAQSRAKIGSFIRSIIDSPNTTVPARVTVRVIETYGLELEDLQFGDSGSINQNFNLSSDTITQNMLDNGITLDSTTVVQNCEWTGSSSQCG